jgi:hypothetical protein
MYGDGPKGMTYFPDLSTYTFAKRQPASNALNVGWLDRAHPYRKGAVGVALIEKLLLCCKAKPVNRTRGWHHCPFCSLHPVRMAIGGEEFALGDAEIRVTGETGVIFAAPNLICHYIAARGYCPPDEFLAAVARV